MRIVPLRPGAKSALCPYCHRAVGIMRAVNEGEAGTLKSHPEPRMIRVPTR
jgi:hypothetical protein